MRHTHNIFIEKLRQRHPKNSDMNLDHEVKPFLPEWRHHDQIHMEEYLDISEIE